MESLKLFLEELSELSEKYNLKIVGNKDFTDVFGIENLKEEKYLGTVCFDKIQNKYVEQK